MNRRYAWLLMAGHMFTDINQGALPAILPFLIAEKNLSFAAAAGLVFAENFVQSIVQPLFGHYADRLSKPWLMYSGVLVAGLGLAATGLFTNYWSLFAAVAVSAIGIAAFHPQAARLANQVSGEKKGAGISIFSVGGNLGFAVGPILTTAFLLIWGLRGTILLIVPAVFMAIVLASQAKTFQAFLEHPQASKETRNAAGTKNEWVPFSKLNIVLFCRSIIYYGLSTFIPLYWLHILQQSKAFGGTALTIFCIVGAVGTLSGGWLADRFGNLRIIQIGFALLFPLLLVFSSVRNISAATLLLIPIGILLAVPFSPMVVLGQKYLPGQIGLSSGITLGLGISMGGILAPVLGWFADKHGLASTMHLVAFIPVLAIIMAFTLSVPLCDRMTNSSSGK